MSDFQGNAAMQNEPQYNTDADAIMSAVEAGEDPSKLPVDGQDGGQVDDAPAEQFRKTFTVDGREIVVDDAAKYDQWAQQGYNYSQKMAELKAQREQLETEFSQKEQEITSRLNQYSQVDQYARENPEWWNHVEQSWQSREAPTQNLDPNIQQVLEPLQQELQGLKSFVNEYQKQQLEAQAAQQDEALNQEITELGKRFPEVDFSAKDQGGQSLELAVLKHAEEKGISSFSAAFYDYYHPNLEKLYEARGRSAVEKDLQQRKAQGLLGKSQAPMKGIEQAANVKSKSWKDLTNEALQELGLG